MVYSSLLILSSVLLLLATFPPFNAFYLAFVALIPYIWVLDHIQKGEASKRAIHGFKAGLLFGFLYMAATHLWFFQVLEYSTFIQIISLFCLYSLLLALFYAVTAWFFCRYTQSLWTLPFLWVALEYLRSIGQFGNPNGLVGYSQATNDFLLSYASIAGVSLLSFLILCLNCFIYVAVKALKEKHFDVKQLTSFTVFVMAFFTLPFFFTWDVDQHKDELSLAIIQGNHKQQDKFDPDKRPEIRQDYLSLSYEAKKERNPDLILWPETFSTGYNTQSFAFLSQLQSLDSLLLFGSARKHEKQFYNSAFLYEAGGQLEVYDKSSLMPFGEYWPYKDLFRFLGLDRIVIGAEFSPGLQLRPLIINDYKVGVGICLESLYPQHFRSLRQEGADFFVVLSNGAWFDKSTIIERHFLMGLFRAVENGCYLFQSSNTGVSAIVSPEGRVLKRSMLNRRETIHASLPIYSLNTPYKKIGDIMAYFSLGFFLLLVLKAMVHWVQLKR